MSAVHGGDLLAVARAFGRDPAALLDFSANLNPLGPPRGVVDVLLRAVADPAVLAPYPDPAAGALVAALAHGSRIAPERIVIGNGGAALIDAAIRALRPRRCVLPVPAFSEYPRALAAGSVAVVPFALDPGANFALDPDRLADAVRAARADACVFANPHNPSGALLARERVLALVRRLAALGCATVLDEAFVDYVPGASIAGALGGDEPVVVIRSLTKSYAMAGLRVGYAFAGAALARRVRAALPSWPVGTLAQAAAVAALADDAYAERTRALNAGERERLAAALRALGCRCFPAAANFVLVDARALAPDADALRAHLIGAHGIVVRAFPGEPALRGLIRVAVRARAENERLVRALAALAAR